MDESWIIQEKDWFYRCCSLTDPRLPPVLIIYLIELSVSLIAGIKKAMSQHEEPRSSLIYQKPTIIF